MIKKALFIIKLFFLLSVVTISSSVASTKAIEATDDLLQYKSGGHIIGFMPDRVYMVGMGYALIEEFVGANRVRPISDKASSERQEKWKTNSVHTKQALPLGIVEYPNLWKGVTVRYRATGSGLAEAVYFIEPEGEVSNIRIRYNREVEVQEDGGLRFKEYGKRGYFTMTAPVAWQEIGGKRKRVEVGFKGYGDGVIGFRVGQYNRDYPLIIDPTYQWHTFYGSGSGDVGYGIAIDTGGNVYVTGFSNGTWQGDINGDGTDDTNPIHPYRGNLDIVVLKLSSNGAYLWHTFYGSGIDDFGYAIAIDTGGNVYVTGVSWGSWQGDIDGDGTDDTNPIHPYRGRDNIVVLKLNSSGAYLWHTFYGSSSDNWGQGIAIDTGGNVYVTGFSNGTWQGDIDGDGIDDTNPIHPHRGGIIDIVVLKLSSNGAYLWHTFYGSSSGDTDVGQGIAIDTGGNVYVTGISDAAWQGDIDGDRTDDTNPIHPHKGGGYYDIVVLKLSSNGAYLWHTFYGSSNGDDGNGIAIDTGGNVYVTGGSSATWQGDIDGDGTDDTNPIHPHRGNNDIVVLKLNSNGAYLWHTFYGSGSGDGGHGIAIDTGSNVYVTGGSSASWQGDINGDGTDDTNPIHPHRSSLDIVVLKLNSNGAYLWHTFYGSGSGDLGYGIAIDTGGNVYVAGNSDATWQGDINGDGIDDTNPIHPHRGGNDITILKLEDWTWGHGGDYGEIAYQKRLRLFPNNQTAGTILSNPEGRGDVLIFPIYDVREINGKTQETYFAIINEANQDTTLAQVDAAWRGVAAKLRFREWDKSEECFDADIWLSDNDVWIGVLVRNAATGLTRISSPDMVITDFNATTFTISAALASGFDFLTTFVPGGPQNPKAPPAGFTAADLTNMGYFELIGEERTYTSASSGKVTRLPSPPNPAAWTDCPNTLSGYAYIVRVSDGVAMGYNATAIGNFARNLGSLFAGPGSTLPSLAQCEDGLDQLEFELSREKMYHGYDISAAIGGKFSLIVTFPTKHFHFQGRPTYTIWASPAAPPLPPPNAFGPPFTGANANAGEEIDIGIFDRNEVKWLPPVSPKPLWKLLYEVNIISLYTVQIPPTLPAIGERDTLGLSTWQPTAPPFESGWIWVGLGWVNRPPLALVHQGNALWGPWGHFDPINGFFAYHGLPALGLALQEFTNGLLGGYYGEIFPAFYKVDWLRIN